MVALASTVVREIRAMMDVHPLLRAAVMAGAVCWGLAGLLLLAMGIEALV